jgi:hypothetical protein
MCSLGHSFRQYLPSVNAPKKLFERDNLRHPVDGGHERLLRDIQHDMARHKVLSGAVGKMATTLLYRIPPGAS